MKGKVTEKTVLVYLSEELFEGLRKASYLSKKSMSAIIRELLKDYLAKEETNAKRQKS